MYTADWKLHRVTEDLTAEDDPSANDPQALPASGLVLTAPYMENGVARISTVRAIGVFVTDALVRVAPGSGTFSATLFEVVSLPNNSPYGFFVAATGISYATKAAETAFDLTLPGVGRYVLRVTAYGSAPVGATRLAILLKST